MANPIDTRREQAFPKLTAAQIARLRSHGQCIRTERGQVLVEPGDREVRFFVVLSGCLEILRPGLGGEELVVVHQAGQFSGEITTLQGLPSLIRSRVRESGEVLALEHESLRAVIQSDSELSEIFMRAFILRRVGLIAQQQGDVILLGSRHSGGTLRLQQFLSRNSFPYVYLDVDTDQSVQALIERFHIVVSDVPVVLCRGQVLKNPSNEQVAQCLGMNPAIDDCAVHDLVVIGAGPAGLAAAVYAASEGLDVLVVESNAPGGQAGSSSKIENYLGFPTGISGQALAGRAFVQAQKFGANVAIANSAIRLRCEQKPYIIQLSTDHSVRARTLIVASGAAYRQLAVEHFDRFLGVGVYYAATFVEAQLCQRDDVIVVGGGNSAGQAAVFLSQASRHVHVLVRSDGLADSMSRYLIRRIEESPNITLHTHTEIVGLHGETSLEKVTWRNGSGIAETREIRHVFLMMGADPNTGWLQGCLALDEKGFVRTGMDITAQELQDRAWPLTRPPHHLETNLPGIFAVGDVRSGSVKRVAAAVGEGSACVQLVHRALHE